MVAQSYPTVLSSPIPRVFSAHYKNGLNKLSNKLYALPQIMGGILFQCQALVLLKRKFTQLHI